MSVSILLGCADRYSGHHVRHHVLIPGQIAVLRYCTSGWQAQVQNCEQQPRCGQLPSRNKPTTDLISLCRSPSLPAVFELLRSWPEEHFLTCIGFQLLQAFVSLCMYTTLIACLLQSYRRMKADSEWDVLESKLAGREPGYQVRHSSPLPTEESACVESCESFLHVGTVRNVLALFDLVHIRYSACAGHHSHLSYSMPG